MNHYYITGTSKGIGKALAETLLEDENNRVVGISRSRSIEHPHYCHLESDLSNIDEVKKITFGNLKPADKIVLVNNAAMLGDIKHIGDIDDNELINGLQLNLIAPSVLINRFIKAYKDVDCQKVIINISSGAAFNGYDGWAMYCTSKAGLAMFSQTVDKEFAMDKNGFTIKSIAPGVVDTNMQDSIRSSNEQDFSNIDKFHDLKNNNQLYEAKDVAKVLIDLINNPNKIEEVEHRIRL